MLAACAVCKRGAENGDGNADDASDDGLTPSIATTCAGLDKRSGRLWLDMLRAMSVDMSVGVVASDMRVPGIPLSEINEGFRSVTGYGAEMVGQSCKFLQGEATEDYLVEEIVDSLRSSESLVIKLTNHKRGGEVFQCLLSLKPIFDASGTYAYSLGLQLDMTDGAAVEDRVAQLRAMGHTVEVVDNGIMFGGYQAIARDPATGVLTGATEMRKDGQASGY